MRQLIALMASFFLIALVVPASAQRDCATTGTCPKPTPPPTPKPPQISTPKPTPKPPRISTPAPPRVDPCEARWNAASRSDTIDAYNGFVRACPRHRKAILARAQLRCDAQWQTASQDATLDGFEGFVRSCQNHREAPKARGRVAAIRANPLVDIRGIFPASTPIPRAGLSTESQAQAKLCEGGNAQACSFLANQFDEGTGAPKNDAWAATLYVRACGGGNAIGCGNLGVLMADAIGVRQDFARAMIFDQRGCEGGAFFACTNWGSNFNNGESVERNYKTAVTLYERGCNGGNTGGSALGCLYAAGIYEKGLGPVPQDRPKALDLARAGLRLEPANAILIAISDRLRR